MSTNDEARAVAALSRGDVIAVPTDTVFGLCAIAIRDEAVERIFTIKGRSKDQALPLFVGSIQQAQTAVRWNTASDALAAAFWPGALTLVLPRQPSFETRAAAGGNTLAVRMPDDRLLRALALALGPLTATSANLSGAPVCRTAKEVRAQLGDQIVVIGESVQGEAPPSTIVDCTDHARAHILRAGEITSHEIARVLRGVAEVEGDVA